MLDGMDFEPWQVELLDISRVARLATVGPGGQPHIVPVVCARIGGRFAIAIDEKPKSTTRLARLRNIARDARVSLLFDRYDDDWSKLAWVRIDGVATVLERGDAWPDALAALRRRYPQQAAMDLESRPLIAITALQVRGWRAQG